MPAADVLATLTVLPASIPSPATGVWDIGGFPLRAYAVCIILGVFVAVWIGERRWIARGGSPGDVGDIAIWAVPFGIVGGRVYHVITDADLYFGEGRNPVTALYLWNGGLGIWGAIALGAVGAWIGARRKGLRFAPLADALAPAVVIAHAIGRWGNYFNQELFGRPTELPWGLEIAPENRPAGFAEFATFHPTFLYESLWNLGVAALVIWADRRFRLGHGRVFALYVAAYTVGRAWNESLRIDSVQLDDVGGLRVNVWVSLVLFVAAVAYLVVVGRRHPGRETSVHLDGRPVGASTTDPDTADTSDTAGVADGAVPADPADGHETRREPPVL